MSDTKWLLDPDSKEAAHDREILYDRVRAALGQQPRFTENVKYFQPTEILDDDGKKCRLSVMCEYRILKDYSAREIAMVMMDAILHERESEMQLERWSK